MKNNMDVPIEGLVSAIKDKPYSVVIDLDDAPDWLTSLDVTWTIQHVPTFKMVISEPKLVSFLISLKWIRVVSGDTEIVPSTDIMMQSYSISLDRNQSSVEIEWKAGMWW
jgi:hypothetical protein